MSSQVQNFRIATSDEQYTTIHSSSTDESEIVWVIPVHPPLQGLAVHRPLQVPGSKYMFFPKYDMFFPKNKYCLGS